MNKTISFATWCSGIDAFAVAVRPLNWHQLWCSEIAEFPCKVLAHHLPHVPNHGDMTTLAARILAQEIQAPEVTCAGTPCQSFSISGLRGGLSDQRGQLALEYVRICDAIDTVRLADGLTPAVHVWENVPGVLSSKDNAFGCLLAGLAGDVDPIEPGPRPEPGKSGRYWQWHASAARHVPKWPKSGYVDGPRRRLAWRVLDAQYFDLAQRRARVFVVSCDRAGADPREILFEPDGMQRHTPPSRETGKSFAHDVAPSLTASGCGFSRTGDVCGQDCVVACFGGGNTQGGIEVLPAITARGTRLDFDSEMLVVGTMTSNRTGGFPSTDQATEGYVIPVECALGSVTHALTANGCDASEDGTGRGTPVVAFQESESGLRESNISGTLRAGRPGHDPVGVRLRMGLCVRRLMPIECERLQGFPDNYTAIMTKRGPAADAPRYRALGNSMAVPVMRWIAQRVEMAIKKQKELRQPAHLVD